MKQWIVGLIVILTCLLGIVVVVKVKNRMATNQPAVEQRVNDLLLQQIRVMKGDEFDLTLADGRHAHALLEVRAIPTCGKEVLRLISSADSARAVVKKRDAQGTLIVDLYLTIKSREVSLAGWLRDNKFIWE